jgi:hypothetical protein
MASENYCATPRQVIDSKWWPETGSNRRRRPFQGRCFIAHLDARGRVPSRPCAFEPRCTVHASNFADLSCRPSALSNSTLRELKRSR